MKVIKTKHQNSNIYFLNQTKFKTSFFIARIKMPLVKERISHCRVLADILEGANQKYRSLDKVSSRLAYLYGSNTGLTLTKRGEYLIFDFYSQMVNQKIIGSRSKLLENNIKFIHSMIYEPILNNNKYFKQKLSYSINKLQSNLNDKDIYADFKFISLFPKEHPLSIFSYGYLEQYQQIDRESIIQLYQELLKSNIEFYFVGDIEQQVAIDLVSSYFCCTNPVSNLKTTIKMDNLMLESGHEVIKTSQTRMIMAYTTNLTLGENIQKEASLSILNALFGGLASSRLFMVVREKHGYCYSINSVLENTSGLMLVYSNINAKNIDKVQQLINQELNLISQGEITQQELELTKKLVISNFISLKDNQISTCNFIALFNDLNVSRSIDDYIAALEKVEIVNIVDVAKNIKFKVSFVLEGRSDDEENL